MASSLGVLAATMLLAMDSPVQADLMLQPAAATTNMGETSPLGPISRVRDQSGLAASYTSGVTDFSYTNATKHAGFSPLNTWLSAPSVTTGQIDFDLGGTFTVTSFALWNAGEPSASPFNVNYNVIDFRLLADDNSTFSSPTVLGSFTADPTGRGGYIDDVLAQTFQFAPTSASWVRMEITSNGGDDHTGIREVAFGTTAVPEPSSLLLTSLLALAFTIGRRCSRSRKRDPVSSP